MAGFEWSTLSRHLSVKKEKREWSMYTFGVKRCCGNSRGGKTLRYFSENVLQFRRLLSSAASFCCRELWVVGAVKRQLWVSFKGNIRIVSSLSSNCCCCDMRKDSTRAERFGVFNCLPRPSLYIYCSPMASLFSFIFMRFLYFFLCLICIINYSTRQIKTVYECIGFY